MNVRILFLVNGAVGVLLLLLTLWSIHARQRHPETGYSDFQPPNTTSALPPNYGEQQLTRLLTDRPTMQAFIQLHDALWNYCVRQFEGKETGEPIEWHNAPPESAYFDCDSVASSSISRGFLRVRRYFRAHPERERRGEDLWGDVLYEMNNLHNSRQNRLLDQAAREGKISKQAGLRGVTELEYRSLRKNADLYEHLWKPLMQQRHLPNHTCNYRWGFYLPPTYPQWIRQYPENSAYLRYYSDLYDQRLTSRVTATPVDQNDSISRRSH